MSKNTDKGERSLSKQEFVMLDVDTGIDDAIAILLALKAPNIHIAGITTVFGVSTVEQTTSNTLCVMELCDAGYHIPVAKGADAPLKRARGESVAHIHGKNGIGDYVLPEPKNRLREESAAEFICNMVHQKAHELTLVCTARLTNLAMAIERDPFIVSKVKNVVIMGGAINVPGNVTAYAEANVFGDPEAAQIVFESGIPITVVGLDVTLQAVFHEKDMKLLKTMSPEKNRKMIDFLDHITSFYSNAYLQETGKAGCPLHDPLAMAVVIDPTLVVTEKCSISIETTDEKRLGETISNGWGGDRSNVNVCTSINAARFIQCIIDTLSK